MPISTRRCPKERCIEGELTGSLNHPVVPATHSRPPAPPRKDQLSVGHAPKASSPHIILSCPSTYGKERQTIVKRFRGGGFGRGDVGLHIKSRDSRWELAAPRCVYFPESRSPVDRDSSARIPIHGMRAQPVRSAWLLQSGPVMCFLLNA